MPPITPSNESHDLAAALGDSIRKRREALSVSQEKFAEMTGHHRTYIGFLERGERTPNVYTLSRVARALGIKPSELLAEAGY